MVEGQPPDPRLLEAVALPDAEGERSRQPRQSASGTVRVWLHEDVFFTGHAVDASASGIRVKASDRAGAFVKPGDRCRLELETTWGVLSCTAEIRHADHQDVHFEFLESLPPRLWSAKPAGELPRT